MTVRTALRGAGSVLAPCCATSSQQVLLCGEIGDATTVDGRLPRHAAQRRAAARWAGSGDRRPLAQAPARPRGAEHAGRKMLSAMRTEGKLRYCLSQSLFHRHRAARRDDRRSGVAVRALGQLGREQKDADRDGPDAGPAGRRGNWELGAGKRTAEEKVGGAGEGGEERIRRPSRQGRRTTR